MCHCGLLRHYEALRLLHYGSWAVCCDVWSIAVVSSIFQSEAFSWKCTLSLFIERLSCLLIQTHNLYPTFPVCLSKSQTEFRIINFLFTNTYKIAWWDHTGKLRAHQPVREQYQQSFRYWVPRTEFGGRRLVLSGYKLGFRPIIGALAWVATAEIQ